MLVRLFCSLCSQNKNDICINRYIHKRKYESKKSFSSYVNMNVIINVYVIYIYIYMFKKETFGQYEDMKLIKEKNYHQTISMITLKLL